MFVVLRLHCSHVCSAARAFVKNALKTVHVRDAFAAKDNRRLRSEKKENL
jgi:hypothetical protein